MNPNGTLRAPPGLIAGEFVLRPIREADAESDHEAVMETRGFLREWEGTGWPDENFTVEANREDLLRLERRHSDGESFTYTVVSSAQTNCLGCVYVFPTSAKLFSNALVGRIGQDNWNDFGAAIYFWVRQSRLPDRLDERLVEALDEWLRREWEIEHYLFITSEVAAHQVQLLQRFGRTKRFELSFPNKSRKELAFA
jgi:hypothetical protein